MQAHAQAAKQRNNTVIGCIVWLVFGLCVLAAGASLSYAYFTSKYQMQQFVPYRTQLTQVVLGYKFTPGYPTVTVSMSEFRKQSAGLPFILSYAPEWEMGRPDPNKPALWTVSYMLKKPGVDLYYFAQEQIPDYGDSGVGTFGFAERTAFDLQEVAFVSVKLGASLTGVIWLVIATIGCLISGISVLVAYSEF